MIVNTAWIFDIDGVVSDPSEKKTKEPQILLHISDKLKGGEPVAFNTGRSSSWLIKRVINPLLEMTQDKSVLQNFIAVSENGEHWLTFDRESQMQEQKDNLRSAPKMDKGFAIERILNLLNKKGVEPKQFIAFSDTASDISMAQKLREKNLAFTFIFVDDKGGLKGLERPFPIVYAKI